MDVAGTVGELRLALTDARSSGRTVGFVPTMGALHVGHRSLIESARRASDVVVVSIFVNPTQFGPGEDFGAYPRQVEADLGVCRELGVDVVFLPSVDEVYPDGWGTVVGVPELSGVLCGASRAGHFDGVATVVARLFGLVRSDLAFFGEKDFQQLRIIERMSRDLALGVRIVRCETVRESGGLAVSSRNSYLSESERKRAASLYRAMRSAVDAIRRGERDSSVLVERMRAEISSAGDCDSECDVEYVSIVDSDTLRSLETVTENARICVAARVGGVRLIDNVAVDDAVATR